jgi:hypothetical protein
VILREDTEEPRKHLLSLYGLSTTAILQLEECITKKQRQSLNKYIYQCSLQLETFKDGKIKQSKKNMAEKTPVRLLHKRPNLCIPKILSLVLGHLCVAEDAAFLDNKLRHFCSEHLPLLGRIAASAIRLISPRGFP